MKQCRKCNKTKPYSQFHKFAKSPDGYKTWCKLCVKEYDQNRIDSFRVYPKKISGEKIHCRRCDKYLDQSEFWGKKTNCKKCTKELGHTNNIKRFSLSVDEYIEMEKSQNGLCKICGGIDNKRLSVDHDHSCCPGAYSCGKCIRGLVCSRCNKALGMVNDDIQILKKMIKYLTICQ